MTNKSNFEERYLSVKSCDWFQDKIKASISNKLIQKWNIQEVTASILAGRGITSEDNLLNIFSPRLVNLQNPLSLYDCEKSVKILTQSIFDNNYIGIISDYDVDGACSASLLCSFLDHYNIKSSVVIPDRLNEGYGPNQRCFNELKKKKCDLIITLDSGSGCQNILNDNKKVHCPVIIIDHHNCTSSKNENILAHINPNQPCDNSGLNNLCATGVLFMVLIALQKSLSENRIKQPTLNKVNFNLKASLDLVALATICDIVPLTGINRIFVSQGLKVIEKSNNIGINSLISISKIKGPFSVSHFGFTLGPRLNAGSRMGKSDLAFKLLSSKTDVEARQYSIALNEFNDLRRNIVIKNIDNLENSNKNISHFTNQNAYLCGSKDWSLGIVGLLASNLVDKHNKPAFVMSLNQNNISAKGSARSIKGINLSKLIDKAISSGVLTSGGGHAMAAGFTLTTKQIPLFADFLDNRIDEFQDLNFSTTKRKKFDAVLNIANFNTNLQFQISRLAPFGMGNYEPIFKIHNVLFLSYERIKQNHIAIKITDKSNTLSTIKGIIFNEYNSSLGVFLKNQIGEQLDLICRIKAGFKRYSAPELNIIDVFKSR